MKTNIHDTIECMNVLRNLVNSANAMLRTHTLDVKTSHASDDDMDECIEKAFVKQDRFLARLEQARLFIANAQTTNEKSIRKDIE